MRPPPEIAAQVAHWLAQSGNASEPRYASVSGGCVSPAAQVHCGTQSYFIKWAETDSSGLSFAAERDGLLALAASGAVRTPAVLQLHPRWLLLEWLPPHPVGLAAWRDLGARLARLHRQAAPRFGWQASNYIGALSQPNDPDDDWPRFWRDRRLRAQLERPAAKRLLSARDHADFERLFDGLPNLLAIGQQEGPSLLHGDLWSGNAHPMKEQIALIDPAVYYGHREVDLAMADLLGGFPADFRAGYEAEWPTTRNGLAQRRAAYQLYYLLVHVNMFGGGYLAGVRDALAAALV